MALFGQGHIHEQAFNTGLFAVREDIPTCLKAVLCPFYLIGKNKAEADGRKMSLLDMALCPSEYYTRQQIRAKYNMDTDHWMDALTIMFCCPCAVCQDSRELTLRKKALVAKYRPTTLEMD
mmetsp:Transcript_79221/g.139800  ORF Transcript_79221/g.139800 Transcript_79221/m.139800 type:complete len:121 (-) Transcript_79221:79-441(-)